MPVWAAPVKKSSKNLVRTAICSVRVLRFSIGSSSRLRSPSKMRTNGARPTARTSGSAKGASSSGPGPPGAHARAGATMVAVAPTLEARSQLSSWVRGIERLLFLVGQRAADIETVGERQIVFYDRRKSVGREQLPDGAAAHLPSVIGQVYRCFVALAEVDQLGHVEVEPVFTPTLRNGPHAFFDPFLVPRLAGGPAL